MIEPYPKLRGREEFIQWAWEKRSQWPQDWDDKVFLGRALDLIGRAKFGSDWTGRDPEGMPNIKALPDEWANAANHIRGPIAEQNWQDAVAAREEHRRLALASFARWNEVTETMAGALRGSGLAAFGRGKKSTHFIPIDRQSFNLDDMRPLFKNLSLRIAVSYMDMAECWVFVDADDLAALLASIAEPHTGACDATELRPALNAETPPEPAPAMPETGTPPAPAVRSPSGQKASQPGRKRRAPSDQQKAIAAWLIAKGHKSWPDDESDRAIADLVTDWTETQEKYVVVGPRLVENWRKSERARLFFESRKSSETK